MERDGRIGVRYEDVRACFHLVYHGMNEELVFGGCGRGIVPRHRDLHLEIESSPGGQVERIHAHGIEVYLGVALSVGGDVEQCLIPPFTVDIVGSDVYEQCRPDAAEHVHLDLVVPLLSFLVIVRMDGEHGLIRSSEGLFSWSDVYTCLQLGVRSLAHVIRGTCLACMVVIVGEICLYCDPFHALRDVEGDIRPSVLHSPVQFHVEHGTRIVPPPSAIVHAIHIDLPFISPPVPSRVLISVLVTFYPVTHGPLVNRRAEHVFHLHRYLHLPGSER